jgi:hypothetical protein
MEPSALEKLPALLILTVLRTVRDSKSLRLFSPSRF